MNAEKASLASNQQSVIPVSKRIIHRSPSSSSSNPSVASRIIKRIAVRNKKAVNNPPCDVLYHPCTKEPLSSIEELEGIIRQLKKVKALEETGRYGLTNHTSNYDFLMSVFCDPSISLDDMVSFRLGPGGQLGSDIYEVLCRLFVLFGGIPSLSMDDYHFMSKIENNNSVHTDHIANLKSIICKATSASGISDITLVRSKDSTTSTALTTIAPYCEVGCEMVQPKEIRTYVMSVKWYHREKSAEHYDLEKLTTYSQYKLPKERQPFGIIVFLKSKDEFQRAHRRAHRQYSQYLADSFFGWEEDVKPFLQSIRHSLFEKAAIMNTTPQKLIQHQLQAGRKDKPVLTLQLHQDIIVESIHDAMDENKKNNSDQRYIIGVLPRGGKTFIAGGIIREWMRRNNKEVCNVFWITGAPNETRTQVKNDLIERFQDFETFDFIEVKQVKDLPKTNQVRSRFFFISIQLLFTTKTGRSITRSFLDQLLSGNEAHSIDLLFFDEAHAGGTGEQYGSALTSFITHYHQPIPVIFLTATYLSIISEYKIVSSNLFIWDYADIVQTRAIGTDSERDQAIENLWNRFGKDLVTKVITRRLSYHDSFPSMARPYIEFPELFFMSSEFTEEAKNKFLHQDVYDPNKGISMSSIFGMVQENLLSPLLTENGFVRKDAYRSFANLIHPRNLISIITPSQPDQIFLDTDEKGGEPLHVQKGEEDPSILKRIERISRDTHSRFILDETPTLLMFLPTGGIGSDINRLLCAFSSLLMNHVWWRERYEVACIMGEKSQLPIQGGVEYGLENVHIIRDHLKTSILTLERTLRCEKKKGLVILAGERLSMGISLPCTDVVFLLNDSRSPDRMIQKMYRALTPSSGKKSAFVVDLNPIRTFAATYGYTRAAYESIHAIQTPSSILDIIYDVYSWDADYMGEYSISKGKKVKAISTMEKLKEMLEMASKDAAYGILSNIKNVEKQLMDNIQKQEGITDLISDLISTFSDHSAAVSYQNDTPMLELKSGALIRRIPGSLKNASSEEDSSNEEKDTEDTEEILIRNYAEAVTDFIKYLSITTTKHTLEDAIEEFEAYVENNTGSRLYEDVLYMMYSRGHITEEVMEDASLRVIVMTLIIKTIKEYSLLTSRNIFRQMRGKIDEPSIRKNEVLKIIHHHLTPKRKQKEEKGEVFTPIEFVEDMMAHLPKSVWSNPNLTWLDPANGIGNFPFVVFYKLDTGLKEWEPNTTKRRKHIIQNMLYMIEIQSNNTRIARNIFEKLCDACKPNIWTTNSLEVTSESLKKHNWPEKYDIIMGNPPFNSGGILKGGGTLWPHFVKKAFELVKENGYICYVHPPGWRKFYDAEDRENQGKLFYMIKENGWNVDYIHLSDEPPKHFPIVDYYVIHAKQTEKPTKYDSTFMGMHHSGEAMLEYPFIPNMLNNETISILKKLFKAKGNPIHVVYNQTFKPSVLDKGKTGIPHYHFTAKNGEKQFYKKKYDSVPEYIQKQKVIMTYNGGYEKGRLFAFYTDEEMGTTNNSMYMLTNSKSDGEKLVAFFNSDIITFLMKITQYSASPNHKNEFKILNQLQVPDSFDYGLTAKEEALIKRVIGINQASTPQTTRKIIRKTTKNTESLSAATAATAASSANDESDEKHQGGVSHSPKRIRKTRKNRRQ